MNAFHRRGAEAFVTLDQSEIRELAHPKACAAAAQSLAEARVAPGQITALHRHGKTEELYHILAGEGLMVLGGRAFPRDPR